MSLPRYLEYKASGVEWMGEVPGHWDVIRLKNVLQRRITDGPHTTPEFVDDGVPFLSVDGIQDGELMFDGCRFISEADHKEYRRKALPQKDDLLMGKAASTGKIARVKVDFEFSIWSPLALIRLDPKVSNPAFYEQSLKSPIVQAQIDNLCTANTQKNISMDDIPKLILTRPPLPEQTKIAAFLDRETAKIDELVAEQRRLMALLKEKRQAVISHAVTQGLNPHAPMKPSGVEWLGDVPEHWEVTRIKYHCSVNGRIGFRGYTTEDQVDEGNGALVLGATHITSLGEINLDKPVYISWEKYYESPEIMVGTTDILVVQRGSTCGKVGYVAANHGPATINPSLVLLKNFACSPRLIFLYLSSTLVQGLFECVLGSTAIPMLSQEQIGEIAFCLPPLKEQEEIIAYLDNQTAKLDTLTAEAQRAIALLQERRIALISAAVTGQIDVRGAHD